MEESDTLPVSAEVLPPSPSPASEEYRASLTPEEFKSLPESIHEHSHLSHEMPEEPSYHSVVDHHHRHSVTAESVLHPLTHIHHQTSPVETEEEHLDSRGKAQPALNDSRCSLEADRHENHLIKIQEIIFYGVEPL